MARWGRRRWKYKEREQMARSEALFAPSLNMRWKWKGTSAELYRDGKLLWDSSEHALSWDYLSMNCIARILVAYQNTPLARLKKHDLDHIHQRANWGDNEITEHVKLLIRMMVAADRRIGQNTLSVWLFTEPDIRIRNIIGQRI